MRIHIHNTLFHLGALALFCTWCMLYWQYKSKSPSKSSPNTTYVVLGATSDAQYLFPLPITILAWRRLGVQSVVCFAGPREEYEATPKSLVVLKILRTLKVQMVFLTTNLAPKHTIAQTCRIFAPTSPSVDIHDDSIVITSDSDLWIFDLETHVPAPEETMFIYNSRCCAHVGKPGSRDRFRMYPMSTIAMKASMWRTLMDVGRSWLTDGDQLANRLYSEFNVEYIRDGKGKPHLTESWYADQILVSDKINKIKSDKDVVIGEYLNVKRAERVDRMNWPTIGPDFNISNFRDAHILHPLHTLNNWRRTLPLLKLLFTSKTMKLLMNYRIMFNEH